MKIVVPTDFSDNALKAALYAAELANETESQIILLNAREVRYETIRQPFPLHEKYDKVVLDTRKDDMMTVRNTLLKQFKSLSITTELSEGLPVDSILETAQKENADLIVMGTTGAGKVKGTLIGTVSASVAGRATIPVLIVPAEYELEMPDGIVFTTDRFEKNETVLNMLVTIARIFKTAVHVIVFVDKHAADVVEYVDKGRHIHQYVTFLKNNYPDINFSGELIDGTDFEAAVALYHAKHQTDISAMVTYPKSFWEKFLRKSVTTKMIYHSHIPVLAIPAAEKSALKQH